MRMHFAELTAILAEKLCSHTEDTQQHFGTSCQCAGRMIKNAIFSPGT